MGRALGSRYTLDELLGSGAMGQVYRGTDEGGRQFAFKLLRGDLVEDSDFISRFHQEHSILVNVRGANLVAVHDLVVEGTTAAIVMDLVTGGTLRDLLTGAGPILPAEVARIGSGIAFALHGVHSAGIVHRDVKPENVLMDDSTSTRTPKLTDFGIAKMAGGSRVGRSTLLAGTPHYIAPEVADGGQITPAADLYSLGILLYELCCGVTPFAGESVFQVLVSHRERLPGRPEGVPDALWDVIWSLLQKNPAARPRSAEHVAAVLSGLADRFWREGVPVGPRLETPPPAIPIGHGNENETILKAASANSVVPSGRTRKRRLLPIAAAAVVLLGVVGVGGYALVDRGSAEDVAEPTGATTTAVADGTERDSGPERTTAKTTTKRVATLDTMPDLVGRKLGEAREKLPESLDVEIVEQVDQKAADGTVLSHEPAAGQKVDGKVTLVVARPAVTVYLDEVKPSTGNWSTAGEAFTVGMAGEQYLHALGSSLDYYCTSRANVVEYNLSKGYRRLVATAGIGDNAESADVRVQLEVFADGRQLTTQPIEFGKVVDLDLDVTNALRLKLQWVVTSSSKTCGDSVFALGEAKLLGLASEVPTSGLPPQSTTTTTTTR
ncbi:protein kinase [Actinosynnema sp. NPDC091369]